MLSSMASSASGRSDLLLKSIVPLLCFFSWVRTGGGGIVATGPSPCASASSSPGTAVPSPGPDAVAGRELSGESEPLSWSRRRAFSYRHRCRGGETMGARSRVPR